MLLLMFCLNHMFIKYSSVEKHTIFLKLNDFYTRNSI